MPRKKKKGEPEYRLRLFHHTNETGKRSMVVVVETIKEFVSFAYEVLLEDSRVEDAVRLKIIGLHAPISIMPGTGPARGMRFYDSLSGEITVAVKKLNGESNEFVVNIGKTKISLLHSPRHPFILFSTDPIQLVN